MLEHQPIDSCPENKDVLLFFPDFKCWTVGQKRIREGWGLELIEWVDQWNEDEFELHDSMIRPLPTAWADLPAPPPYTEV